MASVELACSFHMAYKGQKQSIRWVGRELARHSPW